MRIFRKLASLSWTTVFSEASAFAVKFVLVALFAFLILVIIKGLKEDGYKVQPVQVPKDYHDAGYTDQVVAYMISDKIKTLKRVAGSVRVDSLNFNVDMEKDLTMDVMGVGLSAESIIHHVRKLLGRESYTIGGEITDMDSQLIYNIRMTGYETEHLSVPYNNGSKREAIDKAVDLAALVVLKNIDPYRLALIYYRRDEVEKSKQVLRNMIISKPQERKWAYHLWANIANEEGKPKVANEYYRKALIEDPDFILPHVSLGWQAFQDKDYEKGLIHFEKILKEEWDHKSAHNGAAFCYRNLGDLEKADFHLKAQIQNYPHNIYSYGNYSYFLLGYKKDTVGAINLYEKASETIPVSGDLYVALSSFNLMIGDSSKALDYVYQTLELEPENVLALRIIANYEESVNKDPAKAEVYYKKLINQLDRGQYDDSMKTSGHNNLALVEYAQGKLDSAFVHANKAIEIMPSNPFPWSTLAEVNLLQGNEKEFYKNIEKAIELGIDITEFLDEHPYNLLKDQSKIYQIIERQKESIALKG